MRSDAHHLISNAHRYCDERSVYGVSNRQPEPEFVDIDECAERMNITRAQVIRLIKTKALRILRIPGDEPLVEPAILTGAVPRRKWK